MRDVQNVRSANRRHTERGLPLLESLCGTGAPGVVAVIVSPDDLVQREPPLLHLGIQLGPGVGPCGFASHPRMAVGGSRPIPGTGSAKMIAAEQPFAG
jgi:hypothetical protein